MSRIGHRVRRTRMKEEDYDYPDEEEFDEDELNDVYEDDSSESEDDEDYERPSKDLNNNNYNITYNVLASSTNSCNELKTPFCSLAHNLGSSM